MQIKFFPSLAVILGSLLCFGHSALAADDPVNCYRMVFPNSPESTMAIPTTRTEIWCYQRLSYPAGSLYIYNADREKVRPELALLLDADGTMTHGSLLKGKITVHKVVSAQFNPFSVPLQEPSMMQPVYFQDVPATIKYSAQEVLNFFSRAYASTLETFAVVPGEYNVSVAASAMPFRGYWWPYANLPLYTPMKKYDNYVKARTGTNPGAAGWESRNHRYHGVNWEGHCNGWAASSILRAEPRSSVYDSASNTTFSVSDQKGLLAETDYCSNDAFYGSRYRDASDNLYDIGAARFHKVITYYLGTLGKPIVMDRFSHEPVDNHVSSGYKMKIQKIGTNRYSVVTVMTMHKYDSARINTPGLAPSYTKTYRYSLTTDNAGNVISGGWRSGNPDFIWVPLSPAECNNNNPRIVSANVEAILRLPRGQ